MRHAMRGVDTVIHLAATIRDQPGGTIEELNGLATVRLLRSAERAGVKRFVFFSAMGATGFQRTRFFRSKALSRSTRCATRRSRRPCSRPRSSTGPATPGSPCCGGSRCCPRCRSRGRGWRATSRSGPGTSRAAWSPRSRTAKRQGGGVGANGRFELAGPEVLSYDEIVERVLEASGRRRPLVHVPLPLVRTGLRALELRRRPGSVRHLGGGGADGGADDHRARHGRRGAARRGAAADGRGRSGRSPSRGARGRPRAARLRRRARGSRRPATCSGRRRPFPRRAHPGRRARRAGGGRASGRGPRERSSEVQRQRSAPQRGASGGCAGAIRSLRHPASESERCPASARAREL